MIIDGTDEEWTSFKLKCRELRRKFNKNKYDSMISIITFIDLIRNKSKQINSFEKQMNSVPDDFILYHYNEKVICPCHKGTYTLFSKKTIKKIIKKEEFAINKNMDLLNTCLDVIFNTDNDVTILNPYNTFDIHEIFHEPAIIHLHPC